MALQNCAIETMNKFLNNVYYIPNYQREYSWETTELDDFWDDLEATREGGEAQEHFFGQIVVHNDDASKKKYIIDGQQRTITSTIFMRTLQVFYEAIYKESGNLNADYKKADIASIYIGRYISSSQNDLHLHLGELDADYFRDNIQLGHPDKAAKDKKKSHDRLRKAYEYFYKKLSGQLDQLNDPVDKVDLLDEYYKTFTERFKVLHMEATKLDEAFVIFETLNARGRELETADLLKNFVFSQTKDINLSQAQWNAMVNTLDKTDPTKYIRHFWNSNQIFTREKDLYRSISKSMASPRASKEFLKKLEQYAQTYHDISVPDENVKYTDAALVKSLCALKLLKASSFYPVILAMEQADFTEADIRDVVQTIETYTFRNFTICGKVANKSERFFAGLAKEIYDGTLDTVKAIQDCVKAEMVSDLEFADAFSIWVGSKSTKESVRYILRKIHKHLDQDNEINIDNTEVHIEHIMPADNSNWQVPEDVHEAYLWRLGNLALLSGAANISISNKLFADKKQRYATSKIEPNKDIAANTQWTSQEIEQRQRTFAQYALTIWVK